MADPAESQTGGYAAEILAVLTADPDRTVLHFHGEPVSAGEFADSVAGAVQVLRGLGVGPGTMMGIVVAPNSPDMLGARYAAHLLGAGVCYLGTTNPGSTERLLPIEGQLGILRDTGATVLFTDAENASRAKELAELLSGSLVLTGFGVDLAEAVPVTPVPAAELGDPAEAAVAGDEQDVAVVAFTSGSTGRPKGIRLSNRIWDSFVRMNLSSMIEAERPRILVTTPLSHTVGPMADAVLLSRGVVVLHEEFEPGAVLREVAEQRITRTFMATEHLYRLLDHPDARTTDLTTLWLLIYAGSAAAPARLAAAVETFGTRLFQAYGTSEGGPITNLKPFEHLDPRLRSSVGRPFPDVEVKVCDPETGAETKIGDTGEIWFRCPRVMDCYWGEPELTAKVLSDGWFRTGDIGRLDEEGYLYLVDRLADVVKTKGVKVHPAVVERQILTLPGVAHAAVFGVRDADNIEHLHAAVVLRPGAPTTVEQIRAHVTEALSAVHAPEQIALLDELPLNSAGKPDKLRLRALRTAL
ncbi:AMP-binding protein [Kitasatospora sp. NBC_00240]|uniref:class I adenylate-forming enzyme family protein n=1 Tax=Kitasatospora sp. NBC_00240 TaxID=2903567 RepID=UPI00225009ED|nr:AMP-binding protein [Kitasatospora sp. NBC_00240]MCX5213247.1 AMP-binding protein [Kitasatospora sp. NBC_00240]